MSWAFLCKAREQHRSKDSSLVKDIEKLMNGINTRMASWILCPHLLATTILAGLRAAFAVLDLARVLAQPAFAFV